MLNVLCSFEYRGRILTYKFSKNRHVPMNILFQPHFNCCYFTCGYPVRLNNKMIIDIFFFYEYDINNKKTKILRKINYKQRNLDDKNKIHI